MHVICTCKCICMYVNVHLSYRSNYWTSGGHQILTFYLSNIKIKSNYFYLKHRCLKRRCYSPKTSTSANIDASQHLDSFQLTVVLSTGGCKVNRFIKRWLLLHMKKISLVFEKKNNLVLIKIK